MYVKSMVIDGFKSYGKRQEINGFDEEFNAITGLNGSGKSNILDAICFVLGISNLSHVRAGSLQELVYKNGQAGISKASVTITFDNRDRKASPLGYEQYEEITVTRQVVMGGKNKYLINGTNVQNKRVQDLFCSVQLNVNNPHFLIMQGRITKVLNMKPPEILSMIEEAAGTRMYESKKQAAQKTIEKKDAKLRELNELINEEIAPKIQKLKDEQVQYLEYQKVTRDLERLTRIYIAWRYDKALETVENAKGKVQEVYHKIKETELKISNGLKELKEIEKMVDDLQKKKDEESGSKMADLESLLKEKEKVEATAQAKLKSLHESISSDTKKKKQLEKNLKEDENALAAKEGELKKVEGLFQKLKDADKADAEALAEAQRKFQAVSAGLLTNEDGAEATLQEQLMMAKQEIVQSETEMKQSEMQLKHCQTELKEKQREMGQTEKDYQKDKRTLENMEKELTSLDSELRKLNYKEGHLETLQNQRQQINLDIRRLREKIDTFEARHPQLSFHYQDPEPNFNRKSVKGLVCTLLKLKDPEMATALQVAGGGKLFNVIVDNEVTSKKLLEKGQLQQRTTIIPLNKISGRSLDPNTIKLAQQLVGEENVRPAISLVEYDRSLHSAMEFVFGQTFICTNMEVAKKVTFHNRIMKKSVTLEGDVFDPAGTLSGGARDKGVPILSQLEVLNASRRDLAAKEQELAKVEAEMKSVQKVAENYAVLKQKLELRQHEVEAVRQKLQQTTHHQYKEEEVALKTSIEQLQQKVKQCQQIQVDGDKKVKKLENKVKDAKSIREKELKNAEDEMKRLKKKAEGSRAQWGQREQEYESLNLEIKELRSAIETGQSQIGAAQENLVQLEEEKHLFMEKVDVAKNEVNQVQGEVKAQKEMINQKNKEIQKSLSKRDKIIKDRGEYELDIKKYEHEITNLQTEAKECQAKVSDLTKKYVWIETEKEYFGQERGAYDYNSLDIKQTGATITRLEEQKESLGHKLNLRAMNLLGKEEEQYTDLLHKKRIVENDKAKIVEVIMELDEKKKEALRQAWKQVNKDFGSIFSSLLPGARACLKPPEGMDVLDGLEVKVGFGDTWKESLGELSGGQRSLVALSLILSMLLFKPAPIYILDEVDAALDLSHTQNIGNMLKKHFKHSQFIVVSLKDGMFNNANVLFRTEFIDGMSTVARHVQSNRR